MVHHLPGVRLVEALAYGGNELGLAGEAIELLGGKQHRGSLSVLRDHQRTASLSKAPDAFGEVGLEIRDRDDVIGYLQSDRPVW